ncbi:MAG: hypothetical protein ACRDZ4_07205 [Egibacteraceae bacterium]
MRPIQAREAKKSGRGRVRAALDGVFERCSGDVRRVFGHAGTAAGPLVGLL